MPARDTDGFEITAEIGTDTEHVVLDSIYGRDSVYAVFPLDADTATHVEDIEDRIEYKGYVVQNDAIKQIKPRNRKYCVFSKTFLEPATDRFVILMDKVFGLCGHDVPPNMKDTVPDDAVWISDTFVMYPDKVSGEEVRMVLLPYDLKFLNAIDGVDGALAYNPSLESDKYLRQRFGFDEYHRATSTIVALDLL